MQDNGFKRLILATSVAATGAEAVPIPAMPQKAASAAENIWRKWQDALKAGEYIGQDGKEVVISTLQKKLADQYVTVSFGFGCCEQLCPTINQSLAALSAVKPAGLTSIVICADPETDGKNAETRAAFMKRLKKDGIKHEIVILYPAKDKALSNKAEILVAKKGFGATVNNSESKNHTSRIALYAPGGDYKTFEVANGDFEKFKAWGDILNAPKPIKRPSF